MPEKRVLPVEDSIHEVLREFGILYNYKGHRHIVEAVQLTCRGWRIGRPLYEQIGKQNGLTYQALQRNMQTCLRLAKQNAPEFYEKVTGLSVQGGKSSLRQFIQGIVNWLQKNQAVIVPPVRGVGFTITWEPRTVPLDLSEPIGGDGEGQKTT